MLHFVTSLSELVIKVEIYITNGGGVKVTDGRDDNQVNQRGGQKFLSRETCINYYLSNITLVFCTKLIDFI